MKKLIKILFLLMSMIGCVYGADQNSDVEEIEKHIRWLVPDDGKVNGIAHIYLVKSGNLAGKLIIKHVFNQPEGFFKSSDKNVDEWLYGTQSNAASVLLEMGYIKALPTLRKHLNGDVPKYLKDALRESIKNLENAKKNDR